MLSFFQIIENFQIVAWFVVATILAILVVALKARTGDRMLRAIVLLFAMVVFELATDMYILLIRIWQLNGPNLIIWGVLKVTALSGIILTGANLLRVLMYEPVKQWIKAQVRGLING
ncbi:MAG: hypothetical protein AAF485_28485 [Chloroflexota bacterium]